MPTFTNAATQDLTNFGIQGLRVYLQLFTAGTYSADLVDMGNIENLAKSQETEENNLESARNGIRTVVKPLTSSFSETITFDSLNFGDPVIAGLYEGSDALTMVAPAGKIVIRTPGAKRQARLYILNPGAPNTDSTLLFIPKITIQGTEETQSNGTEAGRLGFSATLLLDDAYKVPVGVLATNDSAPYGVRAMLEASADPIASLHAVLDAIKPA